MAVPDDKQSSEVSLNRIYDEIAPYYDLLFDDWELAVEREGARLAPLLASKGARSILDATCGTGLQCIGLARKGFEVTGSDSSAGMTRQSRANARRAGVSVNFVKADLLRLPHSFSGKFDAVLSCGNSFSHLRDIEHLLSAFRSMHCVLRSGGWCLFDTFSYESMLERQPSSIYNRRATINGKRLLMYDTRTYSQDTVTSTFNLLKETEGGWESSQFTMELRAWKIADLLQALAATGFVDVETSNTGFYLQIAARKH